MYPVAELSACLRPIWICNPQPIPCLLNSCPGGEIEHLLPLIAGVHASLYIRDKNQSGGKSGQQQQGHQGHEQCHSAPGHDLCNMSFCLFPRLNVDLRSSKFDLCLCLQVILEQDLSIGSSCGFIRVGVYLDLLGLVAAQIFVGLVDPVGTWRIENIKIYCVEFELAACLLLAFLRLVTSMRLAFLIFAISLDLAPINSHSIIVQVAVSQIQRTGFG